MIRSSLQQNLTYFFWIVKLYCSYECFHSCFIVTGICFGSDASLHGTQEISRITHHCVLVSGACHPTFYGGFKIRFLTQVQDLFNVDARLEPDFRPSCLINLFEFCCIATCCYLNADVGVLVCLIRCNKNLLPAIITSFDSATFYQPISLWFLFIKF